MSTKKLLTLSDAQFENTVEIMKTVRMDSFSEFFRFLVLFYEQHQKRPAGRPRLTDREDDANGNIRDEDDIEKYKVPDKFTTSAYSYRDLVSWYEAHPEEGGIPARENLVLHKSYKVKES